MTPPDCFSWNPDGPEFSSLQRLPSLPSFTVSTSLLFHPATEQQAFGQVPLPAALKGGHPSDGCVVHRTSCVALSIPVLVLRCISAALMLLAISHLFCFSRLPSLRLTHWTKVRFEGNRRKLQLRIEMLKTELLSSLASTVYSTGLSFSLPLLSVCPSLSLCLSLFFYVSLFSITSPEPGASPPHKCRCP